jgi:hypothetical protein
MRFLTFAKPRRTVAVLAPDAHGIPGLPAAIIPFPIPARRRRPYVRIEAAAHGTRGRRETGEHARLSFKSTNGDGR